MSGFQELGCRGELSVRAGGNLGSAGMVLCIGCGNNHTHAVCVCQNLLNYTRKGVHVTTVCRLYLDKKIKKKWNKQVKPLRIVSLELRESCPA